MACNAADLSSSINDFTFDVYKNIAAQSPADNAFMSTTSIMVVMTMLYAGARNNTEKQMSKVLRFDTTCMDRTTLLSDVQKFIAVLKGGGQSVQLHTANKLFPSTQQVILEEYMKIVRDKFLAEVKRMDYARKAEESRVEINTWVETVTNGKIKDLLPTGSINPLTAMVAVNAIYFKGNWEEQFDTADTSYSEFHTNRNEVVRVQMIAKEFKKIKYAVDAQLACRVLEIPYVGGDLGMVLILPNDLTGLANLEKRLSTVALKRLMNQMQVQKVSVKIPKFKLETSYKMKDVLKALGMVDLFDATSADLTGMGTGLYVSQVFHKAFVDVNEEGTEAAAATGVQVVMTGMIHPKTFIANHPFLFVIWDHRLGVPLFIGRLTNPNI